MIAPWQFSEALPAAIFAEVRLRTIFECCRWDPQVEDVAALADFALILQPDTWRTLAGYAEQLAAETIAAEQALIQSPALHDLLGLPRVITQHWAHPVVRQGSARDVRLIRFDFHLTPDGWRISEANADVPGGFIEAAGFSHLMAEQFPSLRTVGDPAAMIASAICEQVGVGARVALVHATAFTDDRQVMTYLAQYCERAGLQTYLVSPAQVRWHGETAAIETDWAHSPVDFVLRFFPAEWLPNLSRSYPWADFFTPAHIPSCNPTTALLVQSKRFPLVWDALNIDLPTWRALLPETRDPRQLGGEVVDQWVLKPALGRVGEDIAIAGVTQSKELEKIHRHARRHPREWAAQRRFEINPLPDIGGNWYPCVGVYTVNGRAAGAYGRLNRSPLINATSTDVAILTYAE